MEPPANGEDSELGEDLRISVWALLQSPSHSTRGARRTDLPTAPSRDSSTVRNRPRRSLTADKTRTDRTTAA